VVLHDHVVHAQVGVDHGAVRQARLEIGPELGS
jgi:hypothetical protein